MCLPTPLSGIGLGKSAVSSISHSKSPMLAAMSPGLAIAGAFPRKKPAPAANAGA